MPHWAYQAYGYDYATTGNGAIDPNDPNIKYCAVKCGANGVWELCGDGDEVQGSIIGFDSGKMIVARTSEGLQFRNGGTSPLGTGGKIVGSVRTVTGQTRTHGYVKAFTVDAAGNTEANIEAAITAAIKASGIITDGGGTYAANLQSQPDVIVAMDAG